MTRTLIHSRVHPLAPAHTLAQISLAALLVTLAGCGKPPSEQPPQGEYPVRAVIALAKVAPLEETLFLVGNLAAKESIDIRSEVEAKIVEIGFQEGDPITKGQLLFQLDNDKLQAQVAEAKARSELARHDFNRGEDLLQRKTISQQQFDQFRSNLDATRASLRLARERMSDAVITAPFAGQIGEREVSLGQFVDVGELLSSLVQTNPLDVEFNVPEKYLRQIAVRQRIDIQSVAYPGETFFGDVSFISPKLNEQSRTVLVKALVDNSDGRLKPGMFARLELAFRARDDALLIPEQAISYQADDAMVVVMGEENRAEFRPVSVGLRLSGVAEILSGLSPGERVVVEGFQKMGPGTLISISPKSERYGVVAPNQSLH